jgi:transposase
VTEHSGMVTGDSGQGLKSVTSKQNGRSRSVGTTGHVQSESAVKLVRNTHDGLVLYYKRLSSGIFTWPQVKDGTVSLSSAQLSMLLEGIDWRKTHRTAPAPQDPDRTHPSET